MNCHGCNENLANPENRGTYKMCDNCYKKCCCMCGEEVDILNKVAIRNDRDHEDTYNIGIICCYHEDDLVSHDNDHNNNNMFNESIPSEYNDHDNGYSFNNHMFPNYNKDKRKTVFCTKISMVCDACISSNVSESLGKNKPLIEYDREYSWSSGIGSYRNISQYNIEKVIDAMIDDVYNYKVKTNKKLKKRNDQIAGLNARIDELTYCVNQLKELIESKTNN